MSEQNSVVNDATTTADGGIATTPQTEEKTFTQDQLNSIVGKRLAEEKTKGDAELVRREQELQKREFLFTAKEILAGKGYPLEMLDILNCGDKESLESNLNALDEIIAQRAEKYAKDNRLIPPPFATGTGSRHLSKIDKGDDVRAAMGLK